MRVHTGPACTRNSVVNIFLHLCTHQLSIFDFALQGLSTNLSRAKKVEICKRGERKGVGVKNRLHPPHDLLTALSSVFRENARNRDREVVAALGPPERPHEVPQCIEQAGDRLAANSLSQKLKSPCHQCCCHCHCCNCLVVHKNRPSPLFLFYIEHGWPRGADADKRPCLS